MPDMTGDTRYGHRAGSGATEPKRNENKEQASDWQPRQGGGRSRGPDEPSPRDATGKDELARDPRSMGKATRGQDEIATRRHLEGSEQGPS
jgi:hypothetical protein